MDEVLAACMFGGDAAMQCCCGRGGWCNRQCGGRGLWVTAFESDMVVQQVELLGKRGAVQWTTWESWAAAGDVVVQWAVLLGGAIGERGQCNGQQAC
jgi:hypothetical protein